MGGGMTFVPAQPWMLEATDWDEFKAVVILQKQLGLNYLEYADRYDVRAADAEKFRIVLKKGTEDAIDFEANYKACANIRYDIRTVLVTEAGQPTIDELGADVPVGAAMVAGVDTAGKLRSFTVDAATGRMMVNDLVAFASYKTTAVAITDPPTDPVPPAGGPWYLLCAVTAEEKKTLLLIWGTV